MAHNAQFKVLGEDVNVLCMGGAPELTITAEEFRQWGNDKTITILEWFDKNQLEIETLGAFRESNYSEQFVTIEGFIAILKGELANERCKQEARRVLAEKQEEQRRKEERLRPKIILSPHPKPDGFVYLIADSHGVCKIGISRTPDKRLQQLQTSHSGTLTIIGLIKSTRPDLLEKKLHERYMNKRTNGEWFALGESDITEILSHQEVET